MAFDYEGALAAGYTPAQIADYLANQNKFDIAGARKAGYDDFQIISHLNQPQEAPVAAPVERSALREAADIPLKATSGAVAGVRFIADALGADNPVSKNLRSVENYIADLYSAQSKADSKRIAEIMKEAEDKGVLENVKAGWQAFKTAPVDFLASAAGTAAPTVLGGMGAGALRLGTAGVRATQAGIGAVTGAGVTKSSIYDAVKAELANTGMPADQIEARAQLAQAYNGENLDQILAGTALGGLAATTGLEPKFIPGVTNKILSRAATTESKGVIREGLATGLKEAVPEAFQGSQEQLAQNIALQREGFDVPTMRGVVGAGTLEGLGGFGVGAPAGMLSQMRTYTSPQDALIQKEQARIQAATQEAARVRREAVNRGIREEEARVLAQKAYEDSLRVPLTTQTELDLGPGTTVEQETARQIIDQQAAALAAAQPQGDLFLRPTEPTVAEPEVEGAVPTELALDEDTIKSFGFNKRSPAYNALVKLDDPAVPLDYKIATFDTIIDKNKSKIKTEEQKEAVASFKRFLTEQKNKEAQDELARVGTDTGTGGTSLPAYVERGRAGAAEATQEPVTPPVDSTGADVGLPTGRTEPEYAALEQPEAVAPESTEVIEAPELAEELTETAAPITPRMTPEERQRKIVEQRAVEEEARRIERETNLAAAKAEQATFREAPVMTEAEREGLQAAREFEEGVDDVDMSQRMERGDGTTPQAFEQALNDWYIEPTATKQVAQVVNTVNELPPNVAKVIGKKAAERGIDKGAIQAFTHEGTAYLIADRIKPGTERSVFMHEVGAHLGLKTSEVNSIANKINKWANAAPESIERQVYDAVQSRMEAAKELANEELVAYTVEEAANRGVTPQAVLRAKAAPPNTVSGVIRYLAEKFMAASKAAFNAFTSTPTPQDLIDYVYGSTRKVLQEGVAKVEAEPRLSTVGDITGQDIFRDIVSQRVTKARTDLGAKLKALLPKFLSMYQMVDQFGNDMPALRDYAELNDRMTMTQQRLKNKSHEVLSDWGQFANRDPKANERLSKLMMDATRTRIHPDEEFDSEANAHLTDDMKDRYEELSNAYEALPEEAKALYQRSRALLQENFRLRGIMYRLMVRKAYADELKVATPEKRDKIKARMKKAIKEHELLLNEIRGPYFPLMRFGEFLAIAESPELRALRDELKDAKGEERKKLAGRLAQMEQQDEHYQVHASEKASEREQIANELRAQGMKVRETKSEEYMNNLRASTFGSIDQLEKIFDSQIDLNIDPEQAQLLRVAMIDSVLAGLPENSALQRQIKRRNIAGAEKNMMRAFAEATERDSFYISRLGFMKPLSKAIIDMNKQSSNEDLDTRTRDQLRDVYNNVRSRLNMDVKYDHHPWLSKLTGASSIYHLGIAPSYLLTNMTQPFAITMPQLAGEYGALKSSRALMSAWKQAFKAIQGGRNGEFFNLKDTDLNKVFTGDTLKMVKTLQDLGKLDIANNMDTEVYTKGMSPKTIKFWKMFNWASHNIELMNRLSTALAAFKLEQERSGNFDAAMNKAREAVELTQLDYSDTNAAYFMKQGHFGGLNRVPMQFRKYQQGMIYLLARNFKNAWGGDAAAKKAFLYLMGTQLLMAGVRGIPVAAPLLFLLGAFGDDDDPEGDLETQLRNGLADTFGPDVARVFWKGLPAMMGVDSGSLSMENLFLPFPMMRASAITEASSGKDAVTELMFNLGGAPVSMASKMFDSWLLMSEGDYQKGLEKLSPKFISSLIKAERLGSEGLTTKAGNVAIEADEFNAWDQTLKALGFSPTVESEYYQAMYEKERISDAIDKRRNKIIKSIATARIAGEDPAELIEEARQFNTEHPSRPITGESIIRSVAQRRKDKTERGESGVRFAKRERDIKDVTRFAE